MHPRPSERDHKSCRITMPFKHTHTSALYIYIYMYTCNSSPIKNIHSQFTLTVQSKLWRFPSAAAVATADDYTYTYIHTHVYIHVYTCTYTLCQKHRKLQDIQLASPDETCKFGCGCIEQRVALVATPLSAHPGGRNATTNIYMCMRCAERTSNVWVLAAVNRDRIFWALANRNQLVVVKHGLLAYASIGSFICRNLCNLVVI